MGGQIVAEFIENKGALGSFYNALLSLGEGPVNRLMNRTTDTPVDAPLRTGDPSNPIPPGWLWVNDADASDLEDVEVHVRLGSLEQEAVPGFAFTTQTVTVDADIEGPAANYGNFSQRTYGEPIFADDNRDPTLASDGVTSSNGLWDEYGTAFSMTGEADEFSVTVDFPEGVGKTASDGYGLPWYWSLAARYIELDGSGTPIASGGSEGDGYVRLPAVPKFLSQFAPGQRVDLRFPFYDPQTYVRPAYSRVLKLNAAGSAVDAYLNAPIFRPVLIPDTTTTIDEFTLEAWTCLRPTDPTQPTDDNDIIDPSDLPSPGTIFSWFTTTGPQKGGFELVLQTVTVTIAPGQTRQRIVPLVYAKDTSGNTTSHYEKKGELGDVTFQIQLQRQTTPASDWHHIVFSYKSNVDGSLDRIRIYADGEKVYEALGAWNIGYPLVSTGPNVAAGARVGRSLLNINPFKGWIDNLVLWGGEMTADDVRLAYNGGLGRTLAGFTAYPGTGFTTRLFTSLMFTFDAVGDGDGRGNGESVPDTSGYNHVFTTVAPSPTSEQLTFGPTYGDRGFISVPSTTNTRKRGRYRVEVMRGIKDVGVPVQDEMRWSALQLHVDQLYTYPSSPLLGVRVRADGEINGQAPNLRALGEWRLVPVWDGASVSNPTFNREWSRNPAWICLDAALDPVSGMGSVFQPQDIVVQDWQDFADFCDEPVYDQRGQRQDYGDWTDMLYSSVLIGGTSPGIQIRLPAGNTPAHWIAGAYVGWYGLPAITAGGGPYEDTNVDPYGGGGYEIASVSPNVGGAGVDYVYVHWRGSSPPWTNGALLSTQISASMSGTIEGREPRFQCDAAVDEAGGGWDFIVQTCAAARAVPIRDGRKLRVRVEKPRPVRDLIGQGQVVPGTFEYEALSPKTRTNAVEISFQDADLAFDRSTALDEHPSIRGTSDLSQIRRKSYSLDGVTRRSQVLRHARYLLNRENLIRRKGRFRASLDLLGYEPGDVLQVAHDVADRGSGGRIISQPTSTTLYLDRAVTLESGKSYSILIRYQSAPEGELPEVLSVDETATGLGEKKGWEGEAITLTAAPSREVQKGDAFIWYELGRELFVSIDSISLTPDLQREVSWTEYVEEVYDVEGRDDLADIESESYLTTAPGRGTRSVPVVPEGVRVVERLTRSASGTAEHAVEVAWERPTQAVGIAGYDIFTGGRGAWRLAGSAGAGDSRAIVRVPGARHGDVVRVSVCPRSAGGLALAPDRGGRGSVKMLARELAPEAPSDLAASLAADAAAYSWTSGDTT
ncbi:MAG TPA: phage tail protein, partial [Nannocystaceae bacterium]|nr:phage tail protein [Nannocystaceae bacterium]